MQSSRRGFLKHTTATAALISTPYIWTASRAIAQDKNSKPTIGCIGIGGSRGRYNRGRSVSNQAAKLGQVIAICDVDDKHASEYQAQFDGKPNTYRDYRELLEKDKPDIIVVGTPDHWHVPISIAGMRSGCDVYCEKPLTLTIQEGIDVNKVVKETGRVFQVGTQQRSDFDQNFLKAVAMAHSGRLGDNVNAFVAIGGAPAGGPFETSPPPEDLDWNMWLGPAKEAEYSEERRRMFRWYFDYSGGKMTDWGAHHIDIAQWAIGKQNTGPTTVSAKGEFPPIVPDDFHWDAYLNGDATLPNGYHTPTKFNIDLKFDDGTLLSVNDKYERDEKTTFGNGVLLEGSKGRIFVNRGKLVGAPMDALTESDNEELETMMTELYKGKARNGHMKNFFECVEDRTQPVSDTESHHRTMTSCHLCNISLMLGRDLSWDPVKEEFVGDEQATALKTRKSRAGFAMDAVPV